jgi:hypothetical protein
VAEGNEDFIPNARLLWAPAAGKASKPRNRMESRTHMAFGWQDASIYAPLRQGHFPMPEAGFSP